ncbi:hypothetical protein GDO81_014073 [Engystomops pustulosus]|uniref:Secreted protein n=1 Tax=Engystomops pustulosus TaxID=76066 RepID=A0AAV7B844_ENGPU|nr:hypothetical protein GDO81_014073 [Engystomops pustulosus]
MKEFLFMCTILLQQNIHLHVLLPGSVFSRSFGTTSLPDCLQKRISSFAFRKKSRSYNVHGENNTCLFEVCSSWVHAVMILREVPCIKDLGNLQTEFGFCGKILSNFG